MGCPSGSCPVSMIAPDQGDADDAVLQLVTDLAIEGSTKLRDGDACCAFCAGILMDPLEPPAHAGRMLKRKRACPLSILAYKAAYAARQGKQVGLESNGDMPRMTIDGNPVNPLDQYDRGYCEKGAC